MANKPIGVVITTILEGIGGALGVIGGLIMLLGGAAMMGALRDYTATLGMSVLFGVMGLIVLIFGVLGLVIAWGIWNYKNWARILAIIFAALGLISSLPSLLMGFGLIGLIWNGVILYFLLFDKETVAAFQ